MGGVLSTVSLSAFVLSKTGWGGEQGGSGGGEGRGWRGDEAPRSLQGLQQPIKQSGQRTALLSSAVTELKHGAEQVGDPPRLLGHEVDHLLELTGDTNMSTRIHSSLNFQKIYTLEGI